MWNGVYQLYVKAHDFVSNKCIEQLVYLLQSAINNAGRPNAGVNLPVTGNTDR